MSHGIHETMITVRRYTISIKLFADRVQKLILDHTLHLVSPASLIPFNLKLANSFFFSFFWYFMTSPFLKGVGQFYSVPRIGWSVSS